MQIFLQTCMGGPSGSPGGHAQPRHAQMCGVRVQAWPDTCKDFPAAWNLCHEFACRHVACKFSCRHACESGPSLAKPGRTHARIFLQHGICAMNLPAVTSDKWSSGHDRGVDRFFCGRRLPDHDQGYPLTRNRAHDHPLTQTRAFDHPLTQTRAFQHPLTQTRAFDHP